MILCSIVIPTRNRPEVTNRAVSSILAQANSDQCQIIVVDDCSDFSYEISGLREQDKFIKLSDKSTAAHARNVGIENSIGEIIYLLDSDDYFISRDFLGDHKVVSGAEGLFYCDFLSGKQKTNFPLNVHPSDYLDFIFNKYEGIGITSTLVFSRHLNAMFDPALPKHQDWDFVYFNFVRQNKVLAKLSGKVCIDRGDKKSISRTRNAARSSPWLTKIKTHLEECDYYYIEYNILCGYRDKIKWKNFLFYGIKLYFSRRIKFLTLLKRFIQRFL